MLSLTPCSGVRGSVEAELLVNPARAYRGFGAHLKEIRIRLDPSRCAKVGEWRVTSVSPLLNEEEEEEEEEGLYLRIEEEEERV